VNLLDLSKEAEKRGAELNVLVTRLRYLGDVILTTPAVEALKKRYPEAKIYYLAEKPYGEILERNPNIEKVFSIGTGFFDMLKAVVELRRLGILAAVDLFYNPRSAWICYLSKIPIRFGGSRKWRKRFYSEHFSVPDSVKSAVMHHVYALKDLDVELEAGMPRVFLSTEELDDASRLLKGLIPKRRGGPLIALHPGAKWQSKRWKAEYFAELAGRVSDRLNADVLILTGPGDEDLASLVSGMSTGNTHVIPYLTIRKTASLISLCDALVANDGGIVHLSVALSTPTLALFGPTDPEIWFPYSGRGSYKVLSLGKGCSPCNLHYCEDRSCLDDMTPDIVFQSLEEVVSNASAR